MTKKSINQLRKKERKKATWGCWSISYLISKKVAAPILNRMCLKGGHVQWLRINVAIIKRSLWKYARCWVSEFPLMYSRGHKIRKSDFLMHALRWRVYASNLSYLFLHFFSFHYLQNGFHVCYYLFSWNLNTSPPLIFSSNCLLKPLFDYVEKACVSDSYE